ncbi:MAG: aldo/keto reductase [Candidatus Hydrogenedentes bacterium]|nr:aldo/keto reductase [Candidatus Hydrogenedentota bacterium]
MGMLEHELNRRNFLKGGVATGAALALGSTLAHAALPPAKTIQTVGKLPERAFGKTGHTLPIFAHGGSAMMASDIEKYGLELISMEERIKMVRKGYDIGIRYFDTARIYGESEHIMAEALKDVRENVYLASKVLVGKPEEVRASVEGSLEQLQTAYIDGVQIHGPSIERLGRDGCMPLYEELVKLREEGLVRFIGITGHSRFEEMYKLVSEGVFDTLLIEFGYMRKGYNTRHSLESLEWRELTVAKASSLGMGILAMKVLGANVFSHNAEKVVPGFDPERRGQLARAAIRWVLNDSRVQLLNIGISMPSDIDRNLEIFTGDLALTNDDRMLLSEFAGQAYKHPLISELETV